MGKFEIMNKTMNKTSMIAMCLVVFITGLAFGNFAGNGTTSTGYGTAASTIITIEPYSLEPGETLAITVIPGPNGIDQEEAGVYFYRLRDDGTLSYRTGYRIRNFCDYGRTCKEPDTVYYRIPSAWTAGRYGAVVKDRVTGDLLWGEFRVKYVPTEVY